MVRPIYERDNDLAREAEVQKILMDTYFEVGAKAKKMDQHSGGDYFVTEPNGAESVVEIKTRTRKMNDFKTYIIATQKIDKLTSMKDKTCDYVFLVIKWTDAIGIIELPLKDAKKTSGGRTDRNDEADIEEMYEFPIADFELVKRL